MPQKWEDASQEASLRSDSESIDERLRRSEERYRLLHDTMSQGVVFQDADGKIISMNPAAERILGKGPEVFINSTSTGQECYCIRENETLFPGEEHPAMIALSTGKEVNDVIMGVYNLYEGAYRWINVSAKPLFHPGDERPYQVYTTFYDITERRRDEAELNSARSSLENLIDYANAPIIVWDPKLNIIRFNHAFEHLTGFESSDVIGRKLEILFPDESSLTSLAQIARTSSREHWDSVEIPVRRSDGTSRTVLWNSATLYVPGTSRVLMTIAQGQDITERKKAEEELQESRSKFESLFSSSNEGIALHEMIYCGERDAIDYRILDVNPAFEKLTGITRDRAVGGLASELYGIERAPYLDHYDKVAKTGEPTTFEVYFAPMKKHFRISAFSPVKGQFATEFTDITAPKELESQLKQRADELAHSNAELQQFAYVASHDLQEPLRMVISYLTLLENRYGDQLDPDGRDFIKYAVDGGKRMKDLIDDLLAYSRVDTGRKAFESVDMNELVAKTLLLLRVPIEENQANVTVGPLPSIEADRSQIMQVILNLVTNAIKFHGQAPPEVHLTASAGPNEWTFSIRDNGIGMDMKYADRIFQMFQRLHTRNQYPGTGVGLAIAKKIVERHGGRIWVESEEGKGTTFFFTIPKMSISI